MPRQRVMPARNTTALVTPVALVLTVVVAFLSGFLLPKQGCLSDSKLIESQKAFEKALNDQNEQIYSLKTQLFELNTQLYDLNIKLITSEFKNSQHDLKLQLVEAISAKNLAEEALRNKNHEHEKDLDAEKAKHEKALADEKLRNQESERAKDLTISKLEKSINDHEWHELIVRFISGALIVLVIFFFFAFFILSCCHQKAC